MNSSLSNKIAIVTGAATGIGYAIAEHLLSEGARVIVNDIDPIKLKHALKTLDPTDKKCFGYAGDMADLNQVEALVSYALDTFGRIDLFVGNAGITKFNEYFKITPEEFDLVFNLNVRGTFFLTQKVAESMYSRGIKGSMVIISSVTGIKPYPGLSTYSMSKAALQMMVSTLVQELAPLGISINAIAPGATLTERTKKEEADYEGTWGELTPTGRVGYPEDIAKACLFLLSEQTSQISGQTLLIDGGWTGVGNYPESKRD